MIDYLAPKKVLTPAEYFSKFVNFYGESLGAASGVQTTVDSPTDTTTPGEVPSIYDDQGGEGSDRAEEGRLQAERMLKDPSRGLQFFDKADDVYNTMESYDFSEALGFGGDMVNADDFFGSMVDTPYGTKQSFKPSGAMGLGLGLLMGVPVPLGAMHALNMQGAAITAGKVKASGFTGGALMEINSAKVYRDPGSFQYNGNTQGMSNAQLKAIEGFQKHGYVGDWNETQNFETRARNVTDRKLAQTSSVGTGTYSHNGTVGYIYANVGRDAAMDVAGDYDPVTGRFGFVGANGWQGAAMGTKEAATSITSALEAKYGLSKDSFSYTNVAKARAIARATGERFDNIIDGLARQQSGSTAGSSRPGFGPRTSGSYRTDFYADYFSEESKKARASKTQSAIAEQERAAEAARQAEARRQQRAAQIDSRLRGGGDDPENYRDTGAETKGRGEGFADFDTGLSHAMGGRVGMQAGGEAGFAQRPEFVGGNETPTDGQSIADDRPREVPEGTFVINAAAVDFAGREDIEKMVREAYAKAGESGKAGTAQEVDIAVSEGEVIIPPHIAKIIGYDRLNKINNRGKKEISRRQAEREKKEAAGGGFISRKKFHRGGDVGHSHIKAAIDPSILGGRDGSEYGDSMTQELYEEIYASPLRAQQRRKSLTPEFASEAEEKAYRQGVEFGDREVFADILGKTNFNALIQAAARDTRTLSDTVTTLRPHERVDDEYFGGALGLYSGRGLSGYTPSTMFHPIYGDEDTPFDVRRERYHAAQEPKITDSGIIIRSPTEFGGLAQTTRHSGSYNATLAHELMHKGADILLNIPEYSAGTVLQDIFKGLEEKSGDASSSLPARRGAASAEHRYIVGVIGQAYMKSAIESALGTFEKSQRAPKGFEDSFGKLSDSDRGNEIKRIFAKEMDRVYYLYLTPAQKDQLIQENPTVLAPFSVDDKKYTGYHFGKGERSSQHRIGLKDDIENIPLEDVAKAYQSLNRLMTEDYATQLFKKAVVDEPYVTPRIESDNKPYAPRREPSEPKYERGFLDKMLGITPAY